MMWTTEAIRDLLTRRDDAVERAIVVLYGLQTADEKICKDTRHDNGVGFNATDARFLSSLAEWVLDGRHLTTKQLTAGRRCVMKYAGQLARIATEKENDE